MIAPSRIPIARSTPVWCASEDLTGFVRTPEHLGVMRDFRSAGHLITNTWTAERFDRKLIWSQALNRLTGQIPGVEHH